MLESAVVVALMEIVEVHALPIVGAWLASELLGVSKKTKYNGIFHLAFGLLRAVGKELVQDGQGEYVVSSAPRSATAAPNALDAPQPQRRTKRTTEAQEEGMREEEDDDYYDEVEEEDEERDCCVNLPEPIRKIKEAVEEIVEEEEEDPPKPTRSRRKTTTTKSKPRTTKTVARGASQVVKKTVRSRK